MPGAPAATQVSTAPITLGTRAAARVPQRRDLVDVDRKLGGHRLPECRPHRVGDFLRPRLHRRLILALDHDAQQRLGARVADQHAAAAVERRFDAGDRRLNLRHARRSASSSRTRTLTSVCGNVVERRRQVRQLAAGRPPSRAAPRAPSPCRRRSADARSESRAPTARRRARSRRGSISSITYLSPTGVRISRDAVSLQRDLEADVAHHRRDDRVAGQPPLLLIVRRRASAARRRRRRRGRGDRRRSRDRRRRRTRRPAGSCARRPRRPAAPDASIRTPRLMLRPSGSSPSGTTSNPSGLQQPHRRRRRRAVGHVDARSARPRAPADAAAAAGRGRGTRRRSSGASTRRAGARRTDQLVSAIICFDGALVGLAEFLAVARKHLDAVVAVRVVRRRQHDAEIEVARAGQIRDAGVGSDAATVTVAPADAAPRASSRSIHSPDSRVSRPTTIDGGCAARASRTIAAPSRATVGGSSGQTPATPRTPSVPKSR